MLSDVLETFGTGVYTVTRPAVGSYDAHGRYVPGEDDEFEIEACVQPADGDSVQSLPEGLRRQNARVVFTVTELRAGGDDFGKSDAVEIDGARWYVHSVEGPWNLTDDIHYRVIVVKAEHSADV